MKAAVELVSESGTTAVPVSEIAGAADVSRQVLYLQFGDRDTLLLEAALDLARRELVPHLSDVTHGRAALAVARHFAAHRAFYRAMLSGSCAWGLNKALTGVFVPVNRQAVRQRYGESLDPQTADDLAAFLTGGWSVVVNTWVVEGDDPLDPEAFTDRLLRTVSALMSR
jgi:AcrR family transcriptional regulator